MHSRVPRRRFGSTGLSVSEVSFGAMNLRRLDTIGEAEEILDYVLDQGINLIDTARAYNGTNGSGQQVESEVLVGKAIGRRTDLDEPIVVVTKGHGYTLDELDKDLSTSLNKLGIQGRGDLRIGSSAVRLVYFFHGINDDRWQTIRGSGVLDKIQELKADGVISHIGFSSHYGDKDAIKAAVDTGIFEVVELPYNIFNRSLGEDGELDLLRYCSEAGLGIINMKAFGGNGMVPIFDSLQSYVNIDHQTMLNFCLTNPHIATVDAGAQYVSEFSADIETAVGERFGPEEMAALTKEADKISDDLKDICRECLHCLEKFSCREGIDFPRILALYSRHMIGRKVGKDTGELAAEYRQLAVDAEACTECRECIPWCEYDLDIPNMLKEAHRVFAG